VIAIGLGEPKHAERFCGKLAPGITCLTDSTNTSHTAYGLTHLGLGAAVGSVLATARAVAAGHVQGQATGDQTMLPGTFIVDTGGVVRYAYYSKHAGDHPNIEDLIKVGSETKRQGG